MNWYTIQGVPMYITSRAATMMTEAGVKPEAMKSRTALFVPKAPTFTDEQISAWLWLSKAKAEKTRSKKVKPEIRELVEMV